MKYSRRKKGGSTFVDIGVPAILTGILQLMKSKSKKYSKTKKHSRKNRNKNKSKNRNKNKK